MTAQSDYEVALDLIGAAIAQRAAQLDEMREQDMAADQERLVGEIGTLRIRQRQLDPNDPEMIRSTLEEFSAAASVAGPSRRAIAADAMRAALDDDWLAKARSDAAAFAPPADAEDDPERLFLAALIDTELTEQERSGIGIREGRFESSLQVLLESRPPPDERDTAADGVPQLGRGDLQVFFASLEEFLAEASQLGATVSERLRPADRMLVEMGDAGATKANYEILERSETALGDGAVLRAVLDGGILSLTIRYLDARAEGMGIVAVLATAGGAVIAVRLAPVAGKRSVGAVVSWREAALPHIFLTFLPQ